MATRDIEDSSRRFYFYLSLLMWAIVLFGFVPGFFLPRPDPTLLQNPVVHLHALIYLGWLALVSYQMRLPGAGRTAEHRRLGQWLVAYGVLIFIMGLWVALSRFVENLEMSGSTTARAKLIGPFVDMLVFPVLFGLAVGYRKQPEAHKRLMVLACCMLIIPGAGRMLRLLEISNYVVFLGLWLAPIWIGIVRDLAVERRLHPVYLVGGLLMSAIPLRVALVDTPLWINFTDWLSLSLT